MLAECANAYSLTPPGIFEGGVRLRRAMRQDVLFARACAHAIARRAKMSLIPFLGPVESRFVWARAQPWLSAEYGKISIYLCTVYLILIFFGKRWMRDKPAFALRRPLTMWNTGLAVFSMPA